MPENENIIAGNASDLEDFTSYLPIHDRKTAKTLFRVATKTKALMVIRRLNARAPQMQILVVPYALATESQGIRGALRRKVFHRQGWVKALPLPSDFIFVFGELLPENDGDEVNAMMESRGVRRLKKHKENRDGKED